MVGVLMLLLPLSVMGQELVWSNSFETPADVADWTFSDGNANGNQWTQGSNIYHDGTSLAYGTDGVLRYSINLVPTGNATSFATENDWVMSPEIDLTTASGKITLAAYIGRQRTNHAYVSRNLWIYVSTPDKPVPALSDFQAMTVDANGDDVYNTNIIGGGFEESPWPSVLTEYAESLMDLSSYAGKKIYIAMWSNRKVNGANVQNINIDEMAIYAERVTANVPVTSVSLNKTTLGLVVDTNETLTATITPADATNKEVTWTSSNEAVATVDATGKVTAIAVGTATITVTTVDGSKTATCALTVTAAVSYTWLETATIALEGNTAKVVGANAGTFTKFFVNTSETAGNTADLTGVSGTIELKATSADGTQVIKLKINK